MRFNATLNVDFAQWKMVKMERENNMKEFRGMDEDMPKFGAGSEYNRDLREEVRKKKFGIISKKYRPEAQPWILKVGGKSGKKFKGIREGGVGENAAFYVFTHAPDGAIEAYPLNEWYNFQPIQRYKALSAEEAEHEFGRRKKVLNYFSLMLRKRLKGDDDDTEDPEESKSKKGGSRGGGGSSKELKISEMDDWMDSDDESEEDEDVEKKDDDDSDKDKKKKAKKGQDKKKKKKEDVDDEAVEESDDGDEEGREREYITDSSSSDEDPEGKVDKDMKSVAEEDALRKLLTSDEDSEDEDKKTGDESENDETEDKPKKENTNKDVKENKDKKKKKLKMKKSKDDKKESSSDFSSNSSDSDTEPKKKKKDVNSSRSGSPSIATLEANKRKASSMPSDLGGTTSENSNNPVATPAKKIKLETPALPATFANVVNVNNKEYVSIVFSLRFKK